MEGRGAGRGVWSARVKPGGQRRGELAGAGKGASARALKSSLAAVKDDLSTVLIVFTPSQKAR